MRKRKPWIYITVILVLGLMMLTACGINGGQKEPVTLTVWHVYGGQTDSPLNDLIEEFNKTVGAREGIKLQVTVVSNTNNIHDAVLRAAGDEPGTTGLPDMFISYPKTVLAMPDSDILVDYRDYFSDEELSAYIPAFLEEGEIDGRLVAFPVAKSTEIMMRKKTDWDTFAAATGAELSQLETGVVQVSKTYYEWADSLTPEIPDAFYGRDAVANYFYIGSRQLGQELLEIRDGLSDKAAADFQDVQETVASGASKAEALEKYISDEAFETWYKEFTQRLSEAAAQ